MMEKKQKNTKTQMQRGVIHPWCCFLRGISGLGLFGWIHKRASEQVV